jgi:hypothetical protein
MDPTLAASETRKIQSELTGAASVIELWERSNERPVRLTEDDVRAVLAQTGSMVDLLHRADRSERAALYHALGLNLRYEKEAATGVERVHARLQLTRSGGRI